MALAANFALTRHSPHFIVCPYQGGSLTQPPLLSEDLLKGCPMVDKNRLNEELRALKKKIKSDPQVLAKYDLDGDGEISGQEWDLARKAVITALETGGRGPADTTASGAAMAGSAMAAGIGGAADQIFGLLHRLRESMGVTMLFITHSLAAARNLCDRVGVIYRGHLVEEGTAAETIMHPRHPYTKALLDAHPRFGCSRRQTYDTLRVDETARPSGDHCSFYPRCSLAVDGPCNRLRPALKTVDAGQRVACFLF